MKKSHFGRNPAHSPPQCTAIQHVLPHDTGDNAFGISQPPSPPGTLKSSVIPDHLGSDLGRLIGNSQPPIFMSEQPATIGNPA
jgi:hypothetical protein